MNDLVIARSYVKALIDIAKNDRDLLQKIEQDFIILDGLFSLAAKQLSIFMNKVTNTRTKMVLWHSICDLIKKNHYTIDSTVESFITLLIKHQKIYLWKNVLTLFKREANKIRKITELNITLAKEINNKDQSNFLNQIKKILKFNFSGHFIFDKKIIGGMIISFNDINIDLSLRGKLNKMSNFILQGTVAVK